MTKHRAKLRDQILDYIQEYQQENNFAPSVGDIANWFGTVKSNVFHHLTILEREGRIHHVPGKARSWIVRD